MVSPNLASASSSIKFTFIVEIVAAVGFTAGRNPSKKRKKMAMDTSAAVVVTIGVPELVVTAIFSDEPGCVLVAD